jgi:mannitol-1-phosphate 5-dehydrogenase
VLKYARKECVLSEKKRTYVGFGFGAIQPGLLLYEAFRAKTFDRFVVAEILPELVSAMHQTQGIYNLNLADLSGIRQVELGPVELLDVGLSNHRRVLIDAIADAQEIGTAITTFKQYIMDIPGSLHLMLAEGIQRKIINDGPRAVVYCAENNNHAAEMLCEAVMQEVPAKMHDAALEKIQFLNTVISKMCGLVTDSGVMQEHQLKPMWRKGKLTRALLVEDYDLLLINAITLPGFVRGIKIFEEKENILPFKEAKLFGHNGTHALGAYLAGFLGLTCIKDLVEYPPVMAFLRNAFLNEVGTALCHKYAEYDPLFTQRGFSNFVDGILSRMVNPHLLDTVARVGRDPRRKLGWEDRIIGAIRLALANNVQPLRYAFGAAAALATFAPSSIISPGEITQTLLEIWHPYLKAPPKPTPQELTVLKAVHRGMEQFITWQKSGYDVDFLAKVCCT